MKQQTPKHSTNYCPAFLVRCQDASLHQRFKTLCRENGRMMSWVMIQLIERYLAEHDATGERRPDDAVA